MSTKFAVLLVVFCFFACTKVETQTIIALGGLPLYGLARRKLADDWAALALVAVYFMMPALELVTLFDFHAVGLAPTLLLAGVYFLDRALATSTDPRGLWMDGSDHLASSPAAGSAVLRHPLPLSSGRRSPAQSAGRVQGDRWVGARVQPPVQRPLLPARVGHQGGHSVTPVPAWAVSLSSCGEVAPGGLAWR